MGTQVDLFTILHVAKSDGMAGPYIFVVLGHGGRSLWAIELA